MKKMGFVAFIAAMLFAGSALKAAPAERAGIGLCWGVGVQAFDDSRMVGTSQILNIDFQVDEGLSLYVHTEQQDLAFDDGNASADGTAMYNGIGLKYSPSKLVNVGLSIGKADISVGNLDETAPYASIVLGVDLLSKEGQKLSYKVGMTVKYRMVEINDTSIAGGNDTQNLNGAQFALNVGVMF